MKWFEVSFHDLLHGFLRRVYIVQWSKGIKYQLYHYSYHDQRYILVFKEKVNQHIISDSAMKHEKGR